MIPTWLADTVTADPARMVHLALLWGMEKLELRSLGRSRVPHVNEAPLRARLLDAEMEVAAVVPGLFEGPGEDHAGALNDLIQLDETLSFCRRLGCSTVIVSGFASPSTQLVELLRRAGDLASRQRCRIALMNEPEMAVDTIAGVSRMVTEAAHPAVWAGLQPDPGSSPTPEDQEALLGMGAKIALVRCDFGAPGGQKREAFVPALKWIHRSGYDGPVSVLMPPGLERGEGLAQATAFVEQIRKAKA